MAGELVLVGAVILGIIALLLRSASISFDPSDDEDEGSHVEVATGGHGPGHGRGSGHSLNNTITAEISHTPGAGDVRITNYSPLEQPHTRGRRRSGLRQSAPCAHCGSPNKDTDSRCWSCGSSPQATFSADSLASVNQRLQDAAADQSYLVRKGDQPREYPVESPAIPKDEGADPFEDKAIEEHEVRQEDIPIYWTWFGLILGWIDKWKTLTNTHLKSMMIVASITFVFWGISIIYGAFTFGPSGLMALVGATLIAVMTGAIATLFYLAPGRVKTVAVTYPFIISTVFLPATVIALYEPTFSDLLDENVIVAVFILDTFFKPIGLAEFFRANFALEGQSHLIMWFAISFPVGWILGTASYAYDRAIVRAVGAYKNYQHSRRSNKPPEPDLGPEEE